MLSFETSGDPKGVPVFYFHGSPGYGGGPKPRSSVLHRMGIHFIAYTRPGYDTSDRQEGRSVADAVDDVKAIADGMGIEKFAVVGRSGGGPYALACAALLPERVIYTGSLVGPAPLDMMGEDWSKKMVDSNAAIPDMSDDEIVRQCTEFARLAVTANTGSEPKETFQHFPPNITDQARRDLRTFGVDIAMQQSYNRAFRKRPDGSFDAGGWIDDIRALRKDWGFNFEDIRGKVRLYYQQNDDYFPSDHGARLRELMMTAQVEFSIGRGTHFESFEDLRDVLGEIRDLGSTT